MRIDDLLEHGCQLMMTYGPKALLALAVWVIGLWVIDHVR